MLVTISKVLDDDLITKYKQFLSKADWKNGKNTAGDLAINSKNNLQLNEQNPQNIQLSEHLLSILAKNAEFMAAALPLKIFPPRFNRYENGGEYGNHIDNAVLSVTNTSHRVRSDISATLFLSDPDEYDGGELVMEDFSEHKKIKLAAGDMIIYPSTYLHRVTPVTQGARLAAFFWIQSLVSRADQRSILYRLDKTIQRLRIQNADLKDIGELMGVYHNLLRQWSQT